MVGLMIRKHWLDLSAEDVVQGLQENFVWMAFLPGLGPRRPTHGVSFTLCRSSKSLIPEGTRQVETVTREQMIRAGAIKAKAMRVDTSLSRFCDECKSNETFPGC